MGATNLRQPERTGAWAGWLVFAALMLMLAGAFNVIHGVVALFNEDYFVVSAARVLVFDFDTWGFMLLILGAVEVAAGFAILSGQFWGRAVGVLLAGLNAIGQLAFLAVFPVWSIVIIAVDVVVIYALTVHGRALEPRSQ